MKLLIAIINSRDTDTTLDGLIESNFGATHIASTGGFLRKGNATLMIATEDKRVEEALDVIRSATSPGDENQHRATVFVVNMTDFQQI